MDSAEAPECVLELAVPSRDALLDWLRTRVSRAMLEEIARNDREEKASENLAAIEMMMGVRPMQGSPAYRAREVLQLERWAEPDWHCKDSPPSGGRGHQKRLLACTLLLRDMAEPGGNREIDYGDFVKESASTVIQLNRSAIALGEDVSSLAMAFLIWLRGVQPYPGFSPFVSFCIALLSVHIGMGHLSDGRLSELFGWVEREEMRCREALGWKVKSSRWLTGLNSHIDNRRGRERLLDCGRRILGAPMIHYPEAQRRLQEVLDRIAV